MLIARLFLALLLSSATSALAQRPTTIPRPANRAEFTQFLRSGDAARRAGAFEAAIDVLVGAEKRPGLTPDVMAADLVAVAISDAPLHGRSNALAALIASGSPGKSSKYAGAVDRLTEAFRGSKDPGIRAVAVDGITQLGRPAARLALLKPLASSFNPLYPTEQEMAINLIAQIDNVEAANFLRALDKGGTVTNEWGAAALGRVAAKGYRWPQKPPQ